VFNIDTAASLPLDTVYNCFTLELCCIYYRSDDDKTVNELSDYLILLLIIILSKITKTWIVLDVTKLTTCSACNIEYYDNRYGLWLRRQNEHTKTKPVVTVRPEPSQWPMDDVGVCIL